MSAYDRWLESPFQEQCRAEEAIEELQQELLKTDYNIDDFNNFMDAINCDCLYDKQESIVSAIEQRDTHQLGRIIYDAVITKLESWAESEAIERYNNR